MGTFYTVGSSDLIASSVTRAGSRHIVGTGPALVGTTLSILLRTPSDAGLPYYMAASFSLRPGMAIDQRTLSLVVDPLLLLSLTNPLVFRSFSGFLDADGRAAAAFDIPGVNGLRGLRFFLDFVTVRPGSPSGIRTIATPVGFTIR